MFCGMNVSLASKLRENSNPRMFGEKEGQKRATILGSVSPTRFWILTLAHTVLRPSGSPPPCAQRVCHLHLRAPERVK